MSDSDQSVLSQDEAYDLLSSARRRFVISYLRSQDGPVVLNQLSQRLAAWENDVPVEELSDQQIKRIYVSLYQTHLPKLEDVGLIDYDRERSTLELRDEAERLDDYLPKEEDDSEERRWQLVYASLAVIGLVVGLFLTVTPSPPVSIGQFGGFIIVAFGLVTVLQQIASWN